VKPDAAALRVYSRPGCHLCEQLVEELLPIARGRVDVQVVDIDARPEWREAYGTRIPVVEYRGETVCQYTLDVAAVRRIIEAGDGS
jgi:hypothetical protein